jgi:hypothetical protein
MATSAVFAVIDGLYASMTAALPQVLVLDGQGDTEDPGDFLMIGVEDPDSDAYADSAESEQSWAGIGNRARDEKGTVTCCALSWNGNGDQKAARDGVKAITDAVENVLRNDPTLGGVLPGPGWAQFGGRLNLSQIQTEAGAASLAFFQVAYQARI